MVWKAGKPLGNYSKREIFCNSQLGTTKKKERNL